MTLYRRLEAASSDVSFGKAHEEEAGHNSFARGGEVCGEVNVNDIQVTVWAGIWADIRINEITNI